VSGSDISWAICKSASRSRQITTPATHPSVFTDRCPSCRPTNSVKAQATRVFFDMHVVLCAQKLRPSGHQLVRSGRDARSAAQHSLFWFRAVASRVQVRRQEWCGGCDASLCTFQQPGRRRLPRVLHNQQISTKLDRALRRQPGNEQQQRRRYIFTQLRSGPFRVFCSAIDVAFTLRKGNENSAKEVN